MAKGAWLECRGGSKVLFHSVLAELPLEEAAMVQEKGVKMRRTLSVAFWPTAMGMTVNGRGNFLLAK